MSTTPKRDQVPVQPPAGGIPSQPAAFPQEAVGVGDGRGPAGVSPRPRGARAHPRGPRGLRARVRLRRPGQSEDRRTLRQPHEGLPGMGRRAGKAGLNRRSGGAHREPERRRPRPRTRGGASGRRCRRRGDPHGVLRCGVPGEVRLAEPRSAASSISRPATTSTSCKWMPAPTGTHTRWRSTGLF